MAQESGQNLLASIGKDVRITFTSRMLVAGLMLWLIEAPSLVCYQGLWCTKWTATAFPAHESLSGLSGIAISIGTIIASTIGENWVNAYKKKTDTLILNRFYSVASALRKDQFAQCFGRGCRGALRSSSQETR